MRRIESSSGKLVLRSISIIAFLTLICLSTYVAAVQAQDYVLAYDGPAYDNIGSSKVWWRISLSPTSANPGQEVKISIDFKGEIHYSGDQKINRPVPPILVLIYTGGLTSEPISVQVPLQELTGVPVNEPMPFDWEGTGTYSFDFVIPEDVAEGSYEFQAKCEFYNPTKPVSLVVGDLDGNGYDGDGGSFFERHPILTTGGIIVGGIVGGLAVAFGTGVVVTAVSSGTVGVTIMTGLIRLPIVGNLIGRYYPPIMERLFKASLTAVAPLTVKAKALWKLYNDVKDWLAHQKFQKAVIPRGPSFTSYSEAMNTIAREGKSYTEFLRQIKYPQIKK